MIDLMCNCRILDLSKAMKFYKVVVILFFCFYTPLTVLLMVAGAYILRVQKDEEHI